MRTRGTAPALQCASHQAVPAQLRMDSNTRITELEIKLSFAEDLMEELNRVVASQQEQIGLLQAQIHLLFQQVRHMSPAEKTDPRDDIPPHY